jgi:hypothetical protein
MCLGWKERNHGIEKRLDCQDDRETVRMVWGFNGFLWDLRGQASLVKIGVRSLLDMLIVVVECERFVLDDTR